MEGTRIRYGAIAGGVLVALLLALLVVNFAEDEPLTIKTFFDPITRGARLNRTTVNGQGFVEDAPYALLGEASEIYGEDLDEDTLALARSGRSEGVNGMEARMHVFANQAEEMRRSIFDMTTREPGNAGDGYYGEQLGRRWASSRDPYAGDVDLAKKVLADRAAGRDPTGGAGRFFDKSGFGKQPKTGKSWQDKLAAWQGEGYVAYYYPGASQDFVLFRRGAAPEGFEVLA